MGFWRRSNVKRALKLLFSRLESISFAFSNYAAGWNTGNMESACEIYAQNAAHILGGYNQVKGKANILEFLKDRRREEPANMTLEIRVTACELAVGDEPSMASVIFCWSIYNARGLEQSGGDGQATFIMEDGYPRILHEICI